MKATVIAHGAPKDYKTLERECKNSDIIICADGGAEFAYRLGITPDYLIGDFDSVDEKVLEYFIDSKTEVVRYPAEKDYTDTEICVNKALEMKCDEICIFPGIGGRIDHSLGNIGLLHIIADNNAKGYIASDSSYVYLCRKEIIIQGEKGDLISVLPYKGDALGVSLYNLKYPLKDYNIAFGKPIGISNIMLTGECLIEVKEGELLVVKTSQDVGSQP
jgi:thiamine pyrophosphokinase